MKISVLQNRQYEYDAVSGGQEGFLQKQRDSMEEVLNLAEEAARGGARMIVTTETVNRLVSAKDPRFGAGIPPEPLDGKLVRRFGAVSKKYGAYLVADLLTEQGGRPYNTAVLLGPDGALCAVSYTHLTLPTIYSV